MNAPPNVPRSAAEQARDTAGIIGSLKHEGYVPTAQAEAIHRQVARGEITTERAIEIFRKRAVQLDAELALDD
jgi:Antitoxin VbhA